MRFKTIAFMAGVVLFIIVVLQNAQVVTFSFLFWHFTISRIILIPVLVFIGFIAGFFAGKNSW